MRHLGPILICGLCSMLINAAEATPRAQVRIARLAIGADDAATRGALLAWAQEVRLRTSVAIAAVPATVDPDRGPIFAYPLLYLSGRARFHRLSARAVARLRQHLSTGGMLVIDDRGRSGPSHAFDASVRRLLMRIFGRRLQRVPANHVVYRSFYRLRAPAGRRLDERHLLGLTAGRRYAVLYTRNDLAGAFERLTTGGPARPVVPGGEVQREQAYRLAINLVLYALCLDYKDDHAHVMELLRKRRGWGP